MTGTGTHRLHAARSGVVLLVTVAGLLGGSSAGATPPACDGQAATMVGTPGDDVLIGTGRADVIVGLGGDDDILAQGGSDVVCGGAGDDHIRSGSGPRDRVFGGRGRDVLVGGVDDDLIKGGPGGDRIRGGVGRDSLLGGGGHDRIAANRFPPSDAGDSTWNVLVGGAGNDRLYGATCTEPPADEVGCSPYERSRFSGGSGDDRMVGGNLPDLFAPGRGSDHVDGRGGLDVVNYHPFYDQPTNAMGPGGVTVDLRDGWARTPGGTDRLVRIDGAFGTEYADVLRGDGGRNLLRGYGGDDVIRGRGGNDRERTLARGLDGGPGRDVIRGGAGDDALADDALSHGNSVATMRGGSGDDLLVLRSPRPASDLDGGTGSDTFVVGPRLDPEIQTDLLIDLGRGFAGRLDDRSWDMPLAGVENVDAGAGEDRILGDSGPNVLFGGRSEDTISGRGGDDVLWGGVGTDSLFGGPGTDTCYADNDFEDAPGPPDATESCEQQPAGEPTED